LTFRDEDKPGYIPAKIVMVVTTASAATLTGVLMGYYKWENARRDRLYANEEHEENSEFFDLTDRENHEFRVSHLPTLFVFVHNINIFLYSTCFKEQICPLRVRFGDVSVDIHY
jgi:hypothetical protein